MLEMVKTTLFWKDVWLGNENLKEMFPKLFSLSLQKNEHIANYGA